MGASDDMGERFGPYTVHERLGAGGMATVHRATVEVGGGVTREVALKRLLPQLADDQRFVEDFVREAKLAAQLKHPNIVKIFELGRCEQTYFIAMELVSGASLAQLMQRAYATKRGAPIGVVLAILIELCDALEYATNGQSLVGEKLAIIHRDLTPSNLIVTLDGHLKVIDFGVAKATAGKFMTSSGVVKGKLGYMAFEAVSNAALDARADIFSAGVVAWELLTGRRLFKGVNEYEVITKIRDGVVAAPSVHNDRCPSELDDAVLRALARVREDRWPNAIAFRRALDEVRRYYRDGSTARDVAAWAGELAAVRATRDALQPPAGVAPEDEPTRPRTPLEPGARPERLPEGSAHNQPAMPRVPRPKFLASDTAVDSPDEVRRHERGDTQPDPLDDDVS